MNSLCRVCGGQGRCVNYGAFTCQACRAFFRRHGLRSKVIPSCPSNGQCGTKTNRDKQMSCIACCLAKCFSVGMSAEYMRKSGTKPRVKYLKSSSEDLSQSAMSSAPPCSSDDPRGNLTPSDIKSLSNIIHAYETFSIIPRLRQIIHSAQNSPEEQSLPDDLHPNTLTEHIFMSTQSFVRSIPDFQILTLNEQDSLLQRNLKGLAGLNAPYVLRECALKEYERFNQTLRYLHGDEVVAYRAQLEQQLDPDATLVKLMLIIGLFSSNLFVVDVNENFNQDNLLFASFRLFGSQNIYVELLWKYLMSRYSFREGVIRFTRLVKQILDMIARLSRICQNSEQSAEVIRQAFHKNRQTFLHQQSHEHVPLWGYSTVTDNGSYSFD